MRSDLFLMDEKEAVAAKMLVEVLSIPLDKNYNLEETAIMVLPGMYQEYRITEVLKAWPNKAKYLWVAPTRGDPENSVYDSLKNLDKEKQNPDDMIIGGFTEATPGQMVWALEKLKENPNVKRIIISTAAYHLPRCMLTFIKAMNKAGVFVPISAHPLLNSNGNSFNSDEIKSEIGKIHEYGLKGDVATSEELSEYILKVGNL